jgi:endoglucanase
MSETLANLLKELSRAIGVSGYEHAVRDLLRARYAPYVDELSEDKIGNLTMIKRGKGIDPRRKIMLAAHMDEIGAMVTEIDRGFLHFTNVGRVDTRILMGQEVVVFGRQTYHGVIASRPPHFTGEDRSKFPDIGEYQIDLGLPPEVVAKNVRVGDVVAIKKTPTDLLDGLVSGKALDNRASVAALYVCLHELARLSHRWDVYAVASCQEETNYTGAMTSAYYIDPDVALAIDTTFANIPGVVDDNPADLNKGPALGIGANFHPALIERLQETATELEMDWQIEPLPANSSSDAWAIQTSRDGIPTALLSIPLRYMHSPVEVVCLKDVVRTGRLVAHFIAGLTEDFVNDLIPKDGLED